MPSEAELIARAIDSDGFETTGASFPGVTSGLIGIGTGLLMSRCVVVDFTDASFRPARG